MEERPVLLYPGKLRLSFAPHGRKRYRGVCSPRLKKSERPRGRGRVLLLCTQHHPVICPRYPKQAVAAVPRNAPPPTILATSISATATARSKRAGIATIRPITLVGCLELGAATTTGRERTAFQWLAPRERWLPGVAVVKALVAGEEARRGSAAVVAGCYWHGFFGIGARALPHISANARGLTRSGAGDKIRDAILD